MTATTAPTLSADNAFDEPQHRRGGATLPLKVNAWNRVALSLQGDVVRLSINGQLVYERPLEPTNQRTFGVFHYADQTEARVRTLPGAATGRARCRPWPSRSSSGDSPVFLDEQRDSLTAAFEHDFATGRPAPQQVLHPVRTSGSLHAAARRAAHRSARQQGLSQCHLQPAVERSRRLRHHRHVRTARDRGAPGALRSICKPFWTTRSKRSAACCAVKPATRPIPTSSFTRPWSSRKKRRRRRSYSKSLPFEAFAGRLRLAGRGKTVYFLIAEGDSSLFRLVRTEPAANDQITSGNVRLINQTNGPGRLRVVWKSLSIPAEKLSGIATEDSAAAVAELNRQRAAMPIRFAHDFTRDRITPDRFIHWGFAPATEPRAGGLPSRASRRTIGPRLAWAPTWRCPATSTLPSSSTC